MVENVVTCFFWDTVYFMFGSVGFWDGGSNGAISSSNKSILEKFQMAISPQRVVRPISCFALKFFVFYAVVCSVA